MTGDRGTLFLTDAEIRENFDWFGAIEALRAAYRAEASPAAFPPRVTARGKGVWLRNMTGAAADSGFMGTKMIAAAQHAGVASYLIALFDQQTAHLRALLDGNAITGFRTAATTAVAAEALVPAGALRLAVIGSGFEAKHHVRALASIRPIDAVCVFSPNPASRAAFLAELADLGCAMTQAASAREALDGANLILCAARSRDETPTIRGEWLSPGVTLLSIGSTMPEQREIDAEVVARAGLIVADMVEEVVHDTGDMIAAAAAGVAFADKLITLSDLVAGTHPGRTHTDEIILYKSVGAAIQDLAVAIRCYELAVGTGLGSIMPATIVPVRKWK